MKPDNPIDPISELIFHTPSEIVTRTLVELYRGYTGQEIHPKKPRALVITAEEDHNGAFDYGFGPFTHPVIKVNTYELKRLEQLYQVTYKRVATRHQYCQAIRDQVNEHGPIDLLFTAAHGDPTCMTFGPPGIDGRRLCRVHDVTLSRCFKGLAPNATVVLDSCETGKGGSKAVNLANVIAMSVPKGVRVIASNTPHEIFQLGEDDPSKVSFYRTRDYTIANSETINTTYIIDSSNRDEVEAFMRTQPADFDNESSPFVTNLRTDYDRSANSSNDQVPHQSELVGRELVNFTGQITGVNRAIEVVRTAQLCLTNPMTVPSGLMKSAISNNIAHLQNIQHCVTDFSLTNTLSGVTSALAVMSLITTAVDLFRTPEATLKEIIKTPYTVIKGALKNLHGLLTHPKKTIEHLLINFVKAPVVIVQRFLSAIGLRRRRKKRHAPQPVLSAEEIARRNEQFNNNLIALYQLAHEKWFIIPTKTFEEYAQDVTRDGTLWNYEALYQFPGLLLEYLRQDRFDTVHKLSPCAHPPYTIAPPTIVLATQEIAIQTVQVVAVTNQLIVTAKESQTITQSLVDETNQLTDNVRQLSDLVINNRDKLRNILRRRRLEG